MTTEALEPVCTEDDEHGCVEQLRALTSEDAATVDAVQHVLKEIAPPPAPPLQAQRHWVERSCTPCLQLPRGTG